jgi:protein gp37
LRTNAALQLEILALRHQSGVLQRSVKKPKLTPFDRLLWTWLCDIWSGRRSALAPQLPWEPQIWIGMSVENEDYLWRIDDLRHTGAHIKFLSIESLLGPLLKLNLRGIDWVIAGGEPGPGARPMQPDWVRQIRDLCLRAAAPFFVKQWAAP